MKLGLVAGGGDLPVSIARRCDAEGRALHVIRLSGLADPSLRRYAGEDVPLGAFGRMIDSLKAAGCGAVCLAGHVARPDFAVLAGDAYAAQAIPALVAAAAQGDDALLRAVLDIFQREAFQIVGADSLLGGETLPAGALGALAPDRDAAHDIAKALSVAAAIGVLDIGQGAVVCAGLVLAVEAQEGTDRMLRRVAELPAAVRGAAAARRGVLAKSPKPHQDLRIDMPVIGARTIELAAAAGLAGVAGQAGKLILIDRAAIAAAADRLGLFVWGEASPG